MSKEKKVKKGGAGKFLLGAAVGAGLGILFAPKAGSETRKDLKKKFDELVRKVKEIDMEDVKEELQNKIDEIKEQLEDLDKEKVIAIAKKKGNQIKESCEQLVQMAIDKGTPVLEKAANEVREKTIEAVKEVLEKLEGSEKKAK
ncbi:MAG: hypothetical protein HFG40_00210 [Bacilli bacterium]|nr:hypothetical protein [Bacilli bacterium]